MHVTHTTPPDAPTGSLQITINVESADDPLGILYGLAWRGRLADTLTVAGRDPADLPAHDVERMLSTVAFVATLTGVRLDELMMTAHDVHGLSYGAIATATELGTATVQRRAARVREERAAAPREDAEPVSRTELPAEVRMDTHAASGQSVGKMTRARGNEPVLGILENGEPLRLEPTDPPHVYISGRAGRGDTSLVSTILAQELYRGAAADIMTHQPRDYSWAAGLAPISDSSDDIADAFDRIELELDRREERIEDGDEPGRRYWVVLDAAPFMRRWRRHSATAPARRYLSILSRVLHKGAALGVWMLAVGDQGDWMFTPGDLTIADAFGTFLLSGVRSTTWARLTAAPLREMDDTIPGRRYVLRGRSLPPLALQALYLEREELALLAGRDVII